MKSGNHSNYAKYYAKEDRSCLKCQKIFVSIGGYRLCKVCKDANARIDDPEVSFGSPNTGRGKKCYS